MVLTILRALFVLLIAGIGYSFVKDPEQKLGSINWLTMGVSLVIGVLIVSVDILAPRKKLAVFSGTFLGLIVGLSLAYAVSFITPLVLDQYQSAASETYRLKPVQEQGMISFINMLIGVVCCYLSISFIMQTKDDFRFVIPYVEFNKQTKGARPIVIDTSVLVDGRIGDIAATGIFESRLIVPRFVQNELQGLADSADKLVRARGRRGLDILARLKGMGKPEVVDYDSSARDDKANPEVDQKLMALASELNARVLTTDFNLNKVAQLRNIDVINLNDLATAVKPSVMPGEMMTVRVIRPGESPQQGVGFLDDGTMIVVEGAGRHIGEEIQFTVTNVRQNQMGKMIFGRINADPPRRAE